MQVKKLLAAKGSQVISVHPETMIKEFVKMVARRGVGAAPVTNGNGGLVGIISERDVVRGLDQYGTEILDKTVGDMMVESVVTCAPGNSVADIVALMSVNNIRHLPVLDNEKLAGFVSIRDVVASRLTQLETDNDGLREMLDNYETIG